jgi:hypothetical protein
MGCCAYEGAESIKTIKKKIILRIGGIFKEFRSSGVKECRSEGVQE